ncbi:MAG: methylmalonyl-CoA mutase [Bauldia sp.]|nr:methylmalonyl-CoA mutase [Bauldia sp.]
MTETDPFPTATVADWEALATRSGRVPLSSLIAHTDDGLAVGPLYPAGDGAPVPGRPPGARWVAAQRIDHGDADACHQAMAAALAGGASGIVLVAADSATARGRGLALDGATAARICGETALSGRHLRLDLGEASTRLASDLLPTLRDTGIGGVTVAFDPFATLAAKGFLARPFDQAIDGLFALARAMDDADITGEAIVADGRVWHDAGASEAQELAAVLATTCSVLRMAAERGRDLGPVARCLSVILAADADQFLTIAKFRAVRQLVGRLCELLGLADVGPTVHAETSWRMMSRRDPYLNMLRTSGAAFAAATGGADTITVLPFALDNDAFADRMARNIQSIALDESSLYRVGDPGAGSGAIEALTEELAAAAWDGFRAIEAEGGMLAAIRAGTVQSRIAEKRAERLERVGTRAIEIVGVNIHVDRSRPPPTVASATSQETPPADAAETAARLDFVRLTEPFEHLCARAAALAAQATPPLVFVAAIGAPKETAPAIGDATDALATGGLETTGAGTHATPGEAAAAFAESGASVACIAAGESVPDEAIAALVAALRAAGASFLLGAGGGKAGVNTAAGVDASLGRGANLAEILVKSLDAIAKAGKKVQNRTIQ